MRRFLSAWAWLRWRTFMNAIERSERADRIARLSRALEALGPVLVAVMLIPSVVAAMLLGLAAGFGMGADEPWAEALMHVLRAVLFVMVVLIVIGPIVLPTGRGFALLPRLLLLPVSHRSLFAGELLGGFAEPWTLVGSVTIVMVPVGALIAGDVTLALVTTAGAVLLLAVLIALGTFTGALLHLLMRDRGRGEWLIVLLFTLIPLVAIAPALLAGTSAGNTEEWEEAFEARMKTMLEEPANQALAIFPGELFAAAGARAAGMSAGTTVMPLAALAVAAGAVTAGGWSLWQRTIDQGGVSRGRSKAQRGAAGQASSLRWMHTTRRAIAFSFVQHVLRTARGRTIVLPALIMTIVLAALVGARGGLQLGAIPLRDGFSVAVFGVAMSFLSIVQIWMNQFALDKAGLTMLCVQPLTSAQILRGKMIGAAALVAGLALIPIGAGVIIGGSVHPAFWLLLAIGGVAAFLALAPFAAMLSAVFPKYVDMNSIGQKSNAHPVAGLAGGVLTFASAAPAIGAGVLGFRVMHSATAAIGLAMGWLLLALLIHVVFWKAAVATFERRRETIIGVATGR